MIIGDNDNGCRQKSFPYLAILIEINRDVEVRSFVSLTEDENNIGQMRISESKQKWL